MVKRKGIKQGLRFDVFNRDGFTCKYCGKTPDDGVKLQVDHIIPVAEGGGNEIENLTTACFDCNIGKSKKLIGKKIKERDIKQETEDMKDQIKIMKEYYKYIKIKNKLETQSGIEGFLDIVGGNVNEDWYPEIKKMIKKHGVEIVSKARVIFCEKDVNETKYFYGICKNIRQEKEVPDYKEKTDFYYKYVYEADHIRGYNHKDWILKRPIEALNYYVENYGVEMSGNFIHVKDKDVYKKELCLSEYHYTKRNITGLKTNIEIIIEKNLPFSGL